LEWATKNQRKASFLSENILPMQSGQLEFYQKRPKVISGKSELGFEFSLHGHTEKQMIPHIQYKDKTIVFLC
jgi:hypothetical protein